jgi:MFS family permease
MFSQGVALVALIFAQSFTHFIIIASILGLGTALVYPTFLATVAENTNPSDRAHSVGIFRLWRDMGYAIGAILTGIIADFFGIPASILIIGLLTIMSALIIQIRMNCGGTNSVKVLQWLVNKMTLSTDS